MNPGRARLGWTRLDRASAVQSGEIGRCGWVPRRGAARRVRERGLTLVELIVTVSILTILASAALPVARFQVKRQKERELRYDLWMMRDAIDKYKDAADKGAFQTKLDSQNYPPDLETLVNGVDVQGKKLRFLRKIPVDPMTGKRTGDCGRCRTTPIPTRGAGRACSTCIPSHWGRGWTERSIQRGEEASF